MKSISPGTVTVGVLAIVCGLVGVYVARRAFSPDKEAPPLRTPIAQRPKPGPAVIFARVNLPAKTRITYRDLREKRLKSGEEAPAGSVSSEAELIGRITRKPIRANTMMDDTLMFDIGEGPDPSELIPAGHVAMPIIVTGNRAGKNLVRMGARVNVAVTRETDELDLGLVSTKTLLHNVLVIATGNDDFERPSPTLSERDLARMGRDKEDANQITVAIPQEEANKLITAQTYGSLSVTLVGFDGPSPGGEQLASVRDIFEFPEPPPVEQPVTVVEPVAPPTYKVERYINGKLEVIELPNRAIQEARDATFADRTRNEDTVPVNINRP